MQKFNLFCWILTLLIVALALAGAFPKKTPFRYCDMSIVSGSAEYSCRTEYYYKDGWLIKTPAGWNVHKSE